MSPAKINYKIYQGSTFEEVFRWEAETKVYVPIQTISKTAPCIVTTQTAHNMPAGWRFRVVGAAGMKEINSTDNYYLATAVTSTTIEINSVNSLLYTTYTSGGVVEFNSPVDLTAYSARMQIRESIDSTTIIHSATTDNGGITIDTGIKTISIIIPAVTTAQFTFSTAVYSVELYRPSGVVVPFLTGNLTLVPEITR